MNGKDANRLWRYGTAGLEFGLTIVAFVLIGLWLDGRLSWTPVLTVVMAVLGFAGAIWRLLMQVKRPKDDHKR